MRKRYFLTLSLLITMLLTTVAQSITDGRTLCYDATSGTYLCSVPESFFDDGSLQNYGSDEHIRFTFLPIVRLQGEFGYDYAEGTVEVLMPEASDNSVMKAKVKWRGASTNTADKHKRNYHVKFLDANGKKQDRKFFGLRNDNSWLLDAAQVDFSRVRNRVATDLWNDFASKPYYFDREKKALTGTRGQFVEVFLNDEYRGIYCMTEAMDRSQMKLKKYADDTFHGQLWKTDSYRLTSFYEYFDYDNTQERWGGFETKYPDIDDVNPTDYSTLYDAVRFVVDSDAETFRTEVADRFDIPVLIDYLLFCNVLIAVDNWGGKNMYWACYDKQESEKLTIGVWDLDATFGGYPLLNVGVHPEDHVGPTIDFSHNLNVFHRIDTLNVGDVHQQMIDRYNELRQTYFDVDALKNRFSTYMDMLEKSGAYERETAKWSCDTDLNGNALNFKEEREFIMDWIERRLPFFDGELVRYLNEVSIRDVAVENTTDDATYNLCGQRVNADSKGIVIRGGRKYLQR